MCLKEQRALSYILLHSAPSLSGQAPHLHNDVLKKAEPNTKHKEDRPKA